MVAATHNAYVLVKCALIARMERAPSTLRRRIRLGSIKLDSIMATHVAQARYSDLGTSPNISGPFGAASSSGLAAGPDPAYSSPSPKPRLHEHPMVPVRDEVSAFCASGCGSVIHMPWVEAPHGPGRTRCLRVRPMAMILGLCGSALPTSSPGSFASQREASSRDRQHFVDRIPASG